MSPSVAQDLKLSAGTAQSTVTDLHSRPSSTQASGNASKIPPLCPGNGEDCVDCYKGLQVLSLPTSETVLWNLGKIGRSISLGKRKDK
jgi:hypothetical protein